jgi:hypothetical protein
MKKFAILTMTFLFAFSLVQAQTQKTERVPLKKLAGTAVSETAKKNFMTDFSATTNAQWKRVGTYDEVTFTKDGQKLTAYYDGEGNLVGTTATKKFTDLPAKGQAEIKAKYKDYTIGPVIFFDDNDKNDTDMILWSQQFDDEDLYFVELSKGADKLVVKVDLAGLVTLFKKL